MHNKLAYDAVVNAEGEKSNNALKSIEQSYANDVTDEFIKPIIMTNADGSPKGNIESNPQTNRFWHKGVVCTADGRK